MKCHHHQCHAQAKWQVAWSAKPLARQNKQFSSTTSLAVCDEHRHEISTDLTTLLPIPTRTKIQSHLLNGGMPLLDFRTVQLNFIPIPASGQLMKPISLHG